MIIARKKPVLVEAFKLGIDPQPSWFKSQKRVGGVVLTIDPVGVDIHTLEGVMHADHGDWIIKGVNGELYPCKPDVFEKTYEIVYVRTD